MHLYEERGPRFVEALRGMFALALWDSRQRHLVLARDRFGIKPLYYRIAGPTLSFGSELKALMSVPGFERQVDLDALEAFLAFNSIPAPLTIFSGVRKLPPGHILTWDGGEPQVARYARPAPVEPRTCAPRGTRSWHRASRAPSGLGAGAPDRRRSCRCAPVRWG